MTLVMRATTPVNEAQAPDEDADFTAKVGETQYTNFAAPMNEYSYINTDNGLTDKTFNTTMSRGEYIYMLTNAIFNDDYTELLAIVGMEDESLSEDVSLTTIKDGGDITFQEALNNPENGLPTDMYNTLARAVALGFITEDDLNWDEAITKSDAITLFIDATEVYCSNRSEAIKLMFGIEDITTDESNNESESSTIRTDYPDTRSDHRASWDTYKDYYDDFSVYGTDTAGKCKNDLPYCGPTGYDPDGTILQKRTTDKGYTVWYDTNTGKTYYSSMMLPTGSIWTDITSDGIVMNYARSKGYNNIYDVTYAEFQELLGVYNGD